VVPVARPSQPGGWNRTAGSPRIAAAGVRRSSVHAGSAAAAIVAPMATPAAWASGPAASVLTIVGKPTADT